MASTMQTLRQIGSYSRARSSQWAQVLATLLFAAAVALLLVFGVRDAARLRTASSALQLATQLSERPALLTAQLTLIQRGLESTTYIGRSLRALTVLRQSTSSSLAALRAALSQTGLLAQPAVSDTLQSNGLRWQSLNRGFAALDDQRGGSLYSDAFSSSELSASGRAMKSAVDGMLADTQSLQQMSVDMSSLAAVLQASVDQSGLRLRALLVGGSTLASLMLLLALYYAWRSRRAHRVAAQTEQQMANILSTVREGLFLVDRQMRLSPTCSRSLGELLRLPVPAGLPMEKLLEPLMDAKTVSATLKYMALLWKDKVNEELIESVNPISELEVEFVRPRVGAEKRHLAFSFRRVRSVEASGDYILGVVADITDRVLLARELEHARAEGDTALQSQLQRVDPEALQAFLWSTDVALRKSNAVLTAPGIEQEDLKRKLNAVFRELHSVKGEATALALGSFVQRIHAVEDALATLRQRSTLSGNAFLPVVVRLDELVVHLNQTRATQEASGSPLPADTAVEGGGDGKAGDPRLAVLADRPRTLAAAIPLSSGRGRQFAEMLRGLALEEARALGRSVRLLTRGLAQIPPQYAPVVKEVCIQMIRNAIAHGIERPGRRAQLGKPEEGSLQISFAPDDTGGYELTVEDDGHGLDYEEIVDRALRLDLLSPQQALILDWDNIYRLIFEPGFSTADEISEHAGRGVGLDVVNARVREAGGRIEVATAAGEYTRFCVRLPQPHSGSSASVA
ncbi:MAG TPA: ATP-binding protein [Steroidobacteraceae bacterium]|jgi:signal transduction histidine kinase|nr:ATP-binding protein [Steroidobacteraceae bacterium]